jgi:endonuclease/exonuclease/phosphatase family metal-dependent hydrolase
MKDFPLTLLAASLLGAVGLASSAEIDVMTQNQYVGTDLLGLVNTDDFNGAVVQALQNRAASLPAERIKALAALIEKRNPALVGLQEVYAFTCTDSNPNDTNGCEDPSISGAFTDQLHDTLDALGDRYAAVAQVVNMNLPEALPEPLNALPGIPVFLNSEVIYVGVVDRDVILAQTDLVDDPPSNAVIPIDFGELCPRPSENGCNYSTRASADIDITLPTPSGPVSTTVTVNFERGFVGVDATIDGEDYRFVTTHLETRLEPDPLGRYVQTAQATELQQTLQVLQSVDPRERTLVVGDFNSDPRDIEEIEGITPPYQIFADEYVDVWTMRPGARTGKGAPLVGYTCCQAEDLTNHRSELYERIDLIFSLATPKKVKDARLLGESVADKTPPPGPRLWPSDHASVAARLQY